MRLVNNVESMARGGISSSQSVTEDLQQQQPEPISSKSQLEAGSGNTPSNTRENIVYLPPNMPERVVYVSQPKPHNDTRVTNMLQGRDFHVTNDISDEKVPFQNKVPEPDVHVPQKTSESEARNLNQMQGPEKYTTNTMLERTVYVQRNMSEGKNTPLEMVAYDPNALQERVIYIQDTTHTPEGNFNMSDNTTRVIINDSNQIPVRVVYVPYNALYSDANIPNNTMNITTNYSNDVPTRVVYVPHNMPRGNENMQSCIPEMTTYIHTPNIQGVSQNVPYNLPNRTTSPNTTQEGALHVAEQNVKMARNISKQNHEENKKPEGSVYTAQPLAQHMYSPYITQGGSRFMPQMQQPVGYMPQMQYQTKYLPQAMLQQQAYMPMMNQAPYIPPSPQPIQDGHYMTSWPSVGAEDTFRPQDHTSELIESNMQDSGAEYPDIIDTDMKSEDCCSWFDCCNCFLGGSSE